MKDTVDNHPRLDVRGMKRMGCLYPGANSIVSWTSGRKPVGEILARVEQNRVILIYLCRSGVEAEWKHVTQAVTVTWSDCNFGGRRPRFTCPWCGRRVALLLAVTTYFFCRRCHHLGYSSQSETKLDRMYRKKRKLRKQLGVDWSEPVLFKPKGMYQRTFDRLRIRLCLVENRVNELFGEGVARLMGR